MLLTSDDRNLLGTLLGAHIEQLVWDINAIYFVQRDRTLEVRALEDRPPEPDAGALDEAVYLSVGIASDAGPFHQQGEDGYWYRVVAQDVRIESFEVVRCYVGTPGSWIIPPRDLATTDRTVTPVDCGLLVTTSAGLIPAVQVGQSFGFAQWPEVRPYARADVLAALADDYEILPLDVPVVGGIEPDDRDALSDQ